MECDGDDVIADCDEMSDGEVEALDGTSLDMFIVSCVDAVETCVVILK